GHLGGLADDEQVIRRDLAGEGPVEADLALEAQLSFENEARSESGVARSVAAALVFTHFCGLPSCRRRPCRGRVSLNANGRGPLRAGWRKAVTNRTLRRRWFASPREGPPPRWRPPRARYSVPSRSWPHRLRRSPVGPVRHGPRRGSRRSPDGTGAAPSFSGPAAR